MPEAPDDSGCPPPLLLLLLLLFLLLLLSQVHRTTAAALHQLSKDPWNCVTMHQSGVATDILPEYQINVIFTLAFSSPGCLPPAQTDWVGRRECSGGSRGLFAEHQKARSRLREVPLPTPQGQVQSQTTQQQQLYRWPNTKLFVLFNFVVEMNSRSMSLIYQPSG